MASVYNLYIVFAWWHTVTKPTNDEILLMSEKRTGNDVKLTHYGEPKPVGSKRVFNLVKAGQMEGHVWVCTPTPFAKESNTPASLNLGTGPLLSVRGRVSGWLEDDAVDGFPLYKAGLPIHFDTAAQGSTLPSALQIATAAAANTGLHVAMSQTWKHVGVEDGLVSAGARLMVGSVTLNNGPYPGMVADMRWKGSRLLPTAKGGPSNAMRERVGVDLIDADVSKWENRVRQLIWLEGDHVVTPPSGQREEESSEAVRAREEIELLMSLGSTTDISVTRGAQVVTPALNETDERGQILVAEENNPTPRPHQRYQPRSIGG